MQPTTQEMQAMAAAAAGAAQISLNDLRNGHAGAANAAAACGGVRDDFLDQMFGSLPPSAWHDLAAAATKPPEDGEGMMQQQQFGGPYDESVMLASRLRQHQISGGPGGGGAAAAKQMVLQQLADLRQGHHMMLQGMGRSPSVGGGGGGGDGGLLLPLSLGNGGSGGSDVQALLKAANSAGGEAGVYGGFAGSLQQQQHFQPHPQQQTAPMPSQPFGGGGASGGEVQQQAGATGGGGGGAPAPPRQRVRARRGQATDPHSIAERGEDRREDEGPARTGAQRQQDGQGVDAGRDHRLRQVPAAPSQGAEHEPTRWRRCRRAARGRHVLGGAWRWGQRRTRGGGGGGERQPDSDGAAGGQADGGRHGRRHAVPAGEGPLPHAHLPRLRHLLRHVPAPPPGRRRWALPLCAAPPERRHARHGQRRAGLAEHVRAHGAVGDGQRRRGRRRRGVAAQRRRLRVQAVSPRRPPSRRAAKPSTYDGVSLRTVAYAWTPSTRGLRGGPTSPCGPTPAAAAHGHSFFLSFSFSFFLELSLFLPFSVPYLYYVCYLN